MNITESTTSDSDSENEWFENDGTVCYDEINNTDMDSVEIETTDPENGKTDKTVCFEKTKSSD